MPSTKASATQILLILIVAFFSVLPSRCFAQLGFDKEQVSKAQWSRGFHGFNMIVDGNGLERISTQQFNSSDPKDVLLVVIGNLNNLPLNVTNFVANGGAALLASDGSVPRDRIIAGFRFTKLSSYPTDDDDAFGEMRDCPIVSTFQDHPIVSGVEKISTNRPGFIWADPRTVVAWLPRSYRLHIAGYFIGAYENRNGGRMVAVGDQSVFTNQMIVYNDNALFTDQTLKWLKNDQPKKLLILVNGSEYSALDPSNVAVDIPPPTQAEVLDALQNLPPSAMLDFANSVATVVEDENMVNDLIHDTLDQVPAQDFRQFYIFLMFGIACLTFVAAFLCQRKLQSQTASELAHKQSQNEQAELKKIQSRERQQAAHMLLDRFCMDLVNRRFSDWPSFPTGLNVDEDRMSEKLFKSMTQMGVLYKSKPASFWTRKKLAKLEKTVENWRTYFEDRPALKEAELALNQSHWSNRTLDSEPT